MKTHNTFKTQNITTPDGLQLWVETLGYSNNPAVVLLNPGPGQCICWPDTFCQALAQKFFVIRFDYRDAGLSSAVDYATSPYNLNDLFNDALAILDNFSLEQAHFIGNSMGGFVLQYGAINQPTRIKTMTLMMTSPHHGILYEALRGVESYYFKLSLPKPEVIEALLSTTKQPNNAIFKMRAHLKIKKLVAGENTTFDQHYWYQLEEQLLKRSRKNPNAQKHHALAQKQHPENRLAQLAEVVHPTLVIHGARDPIFPADHAEAFAATMPNAKLMLIPDLGHNLEPAFVPHVCQAIRRFIQDAS